MITKFKLFEYNNYKFPADNQNIPEPEFKLGQDIYYHGKMKIHHGFYIVKNSYFDNELNIWRYDISNVKDYKYRLVGAWESSLSLTKEEAERKNIEFDKRQEEKRLQHIELDPLGEEDW